MTSKINFGRICEDFVAELVAEKTGFDVTNLNDVKVNHPTTDLLVKDPKSNKQYEISIKAKKSASWPAVRGVKADNQFIIFVDIYKNESPSFYILSNKDWQDVLHSILPKRDAGAEIVSGAIEWNWVADGKKKKFRGSKLSVSDIESYINNWSILSA
jgi:hypothetical protein